MVKTKIETVGELVDETLSDDYSDDRNDSYVLTDEELIGASLLDIQTSEQFASSYKLDPGYNVSIHAPDVGMIDMPLKESQARQLIAKAHPPAPHDQGGDITTDASAGKVWELNLNQFGFGAGWPILLHHVCRVVNPPNHWQPPVQVEGEKMVIYEKGATYKAHTDIEKRKGVFGTVMISLPSEHEGGAMVFEHGGQKPRRYRSCLNTQSFVFWYTGVSHRLAPVTSGYRWVLVLKLRDDHGPQGHKRTGLIFPDEHVENRETWVSRKETAYDLLRKMEKSHLEQLLGPDYSLFLDLQRVVDPSAAPQPVARAKRKVSDTDIVDLGGEKKKNLKITSFFTKK
ncbi:hypothetical protein LRP88_05935 [Fusarium phalaenopsidis]